MAIESLGALLLASAALSAPQAAELDAAVQTIYRAYKQVDRQPSASETDIYSLETTGLLRRWERGQPEGEVDAMSEADWLCMCQDWDERYFRVTVASRSILADGRAQVVVRVYPVRSAAGSTARMLFRKEPRGWRLDDLISTESFPQGLKRALIQSIAENERQRAPTRRRRN